MNDYARGYLMLALIAVASAAQADNTTLIRFDGPEIHGHVNTTNNTFVATSWVEHPGGTNWWTPALASMPLTYTARTSSGAVYDVPDNWNGHMVGWAFISELSNAAIQWNEGTYTFDNTRAHGWGGSRDGANVFLFFGEQAWDTTPVASNGFGGFIFDVVNTIPEPRGALMCLIASPVLICFFGRKRTKNNS